ncbi:MAG: AI-2E family transporter [Acidimicrobiales bacterium]|nr:AI-2E family transporter [Acidimicrobiales bacterium]MDG2216543.1 AI-2E family transporter [Acidimicrobiales bacterium]
MATNDDPPVPSDEATPWYEVKKVPIWLIKAIVLFWAGWIVVYLGTGAVRSLRSLLIVLLISLFISFAIEPAVNRMERWGVRRGLGVWIVYLAIIVGLAAFSAAIGTALATQIESFIDEAPGYVEQVEDWLQNNVDSDIDLQKFSDEFVDGGGASDLANRFADDVVNLGQTVLNVVFQTFTVLLFVFYLVAEGPKARRVVCSFLDQSRQRTVLAVWDLAIEKTGGYIYSRGILAFLSALAHWIAFEIIDVPFPVPLALWVGVMSQFIPVVGTYIAGALPALVAVLDDPKKAILVVVIIGAYQQIENYVFAPKVTAHTMEIHVAVAFGSVLAGAALLGVVGALLALPFAATAQAFISGYRQHHDVEEDALSRSAKRRGRA